MILFGVKLVIYILNLFVSCKFLGQFKHFFADLLVGDTGGTGGVVLEAEQFGNGHGETLLAMPIVTAKVERADWKLRFRSKPHCEAISFK